MPQIWPHPLDPNGDALARPSKISKIVGITFVSVMTCHEIVAFFSVEIGGAPLWRQLVRLNPLTWTQSLELFIALTSVVARAALHPQIKTIGMLAKRYHPTFINLPREKVLAVFIDDQNREISGLWVGSGDRTSCPIDKRAIFCAATRFCASGIVLFHNHPSGDPRFSRQDIAVTREIITAAEALGTSVLDHIVFGFHDGYKSMRAEGLL